MTETTIHGIPVALSAELNDAISKHLPGFVGEQLRKVLNDAEEQARELTRSRDMLRDCHGRITELEAKLKRLSALEARESDVTKRESDVTKREFDCRVSEEVNKERVLRIQDLKEVTLSVFSNNRFKYAESGIVPVSIPGQTYPTAYTTTKNVEGQG